MLCSASPIFLLLLFYIDFLFHISNANPSVEDKMLITFMKGQQEIQLSEYPKQRYEAHLGFMHFMRKNWQCDQIANEFDEFERTECQKYRKYLDILYEYLSREYAGFPTVKPKFVFKRKQFEIEGPIIYAANCLAKISNFYFNAKESYYYSYKLNSSFIYRFELNLLNEDRLNYEFKLENERKLPINEMILELAIDTANECQTNESLDGIIRQNYDKNLEEMFKKAEKKAKKDSPWEADEINYDKHWIIVDSKFDDQLTWLEDALFSEFVKGLATNSEKFFGMAKEYSNYLCQLQEEGNIYAHNEYMLKDGLNETEKMKEYLTLKYKFHLSFLYLSENWQCDKIVDQLIENKRKEDQRIYREHFNFMEETIGEEFKEEIRKKCQKYRNYLDILYEYLFRLYVEAKNPKVSNKLPPLVKPIFTSEGQDPCSLIEVVKSLNDFSKYSWHRDEKAPDEIKLINEKELNFEIKEEKNDGEPTDIEILRTEFEQNMKNMYEFKKRRIIFGEFLKIF